MNKPVEVYGDEILATSQVEIDTHKSSGGLTRKRDGETILISESEAVTIKEKWAEEEINKSIKDEDRVSQRAADMATVEGALNIPNADALLSALRRLL